MDEETLRCIEQIIDYKFTDTSLLSKALTHSSAVDDRLLSNERLELLGFFLVRSPGALEMTVFNDDSKLEALVVIGPFFIK